MPLWDVEEGKKSVLYQTILQFIFGDQNVRIEFGSWKRKLFIVKLAFHIFLNHSISISESKFMVSTQGLFDHTKSNKPKNSDLIFEIAFWDSFLTMKTLESSLICEIQNCSSSNHLSRSFWITQFWCQIQKLWSKH